MVPSCDSIAQAAVHASVHQRLNASLCRSHLSFMQLSCVFRVTACTSWLPTSTPNTYICPAACHVAVAVPLLFQQLPFCNRQAHAPVRMKYTFPSQSGNIQCKHSNQCNKESYIYIYNYGFMVRMVIHVNGIYSICEFNTCILLYYVFARRYIMKYMIATKLIQILYYGLYVIIIMSVQPIRFGLHKSLTGHHGNPSRSSPVCQPWWVDLADRLSIVHAHLIPMATSISNLEII